MRMKFWLRILGLFMLTAAILLVYAYQNEIGAWIEEQLQMESQLEQLLR